MIVNIFDFLRGKVGLVYPSLYIKWSKLNLLSQKTIITLSQSHFNL